MKNQWDVYKERISSHGSTRREADLKRERRYLSSRAKNSLSYQEVRINGETLDVSIINSDNLNEKTILSMPYNSFRCGDLVEWKSCFWLVISKDANDEVYTKGKLLQCNHLLKWIDSDGILNEQWCAVEDGTKYLTGEYVDRNYIITRGDSRLGMTLPRTEATKKLKRGCRFIIGDQDSDNKLAYSLTKPLKVGHVYADDEGVYKFVLQEVVTTQDDNLDLGIADYYKHFPREEAESFCGEKETLNDSCSEVFDIFENTKSECPDKQKESWL